MAVRTPNGLRAGGRALFRAVIEAYELEEFERRLLVEAARTVDLLDELAALVQREGVLIEGSRAHPAVVEARQQRLALARILATLRLPAGEEDGGQAPGARRPQRRGAARGVYGVVAS